MTAGAAQALLKGSKVLAGKRIVVAGSGPFLLPVATGLAKNGAEKVWLCEANAPINWLKKIHIVAQNPAKISEALQYLLSLRKNRVEIGYRQAIIKASANESGELSSVTIANLNKGLEVISTREVACDVAAISWGFTPDVALATSLGARATVGVDGAVYIPTDEMQRASVFNTESLDDLEIYCAGELAGVGGSDLALVEGAIAGLAAAGKRADKQLLTLRKRLQRFAKALFEVYPVHPGWQHWLTPETIICRCEEVSTSELNKAKDELGAGDVRTMKLMTRTGMGLCQGRVCSRNICDLLGSTEQERITSTARPIITPITLGELAEEGLL
jgi:NADPH-dependent 2,4-dienoyl-CoA reductase/sulfur reductase-like enzyme